jgi:hypothetical protein
VDAIGFDTPAIAQPTAAGQRWSEREVFVLQRLYGRVPVGLLAGGMGRTPTAIQVRANKLGLRRTTRAPMAPALNAKRVWSCADDTHLRTWWGKRTPAAIARCLRRSVTAVKVRRAQLGILPDDDGLTANEVARICAVDVHLVLEWIAGGRLRARRALLPRGRRRPWRITPDDLETFLRRHPTAYPVERITDAAWRDLAEEIAATDPYLPAKAVARQHGVSAQCVWLAIATGRLPAVRGFGRGWYVRQADADRWQPGRTARANHHRPAPPC